MEILTDQNSNISLKYLDNTWLLIPRGFSSSCIFQKGGNCYWRSLLWWLHSPCWGCWALESWIISRLDYICFDTFRKCIFSKKLMIESVKQRYTACKSMVFRNVPFEVPVCSLFLVFLWSYNRVKINVDLKHQKSKTNTIKTFFIKQSPLPSLPSPDNFRKSGHF